jgi:hypothetical protein
MCSKGTGVYAGLQFEDLKINVSSSGYIASNNKMINE